MALPQWSIQQASLPSCPNITSPSACYQWLNGARNWQPTSIVTSYPGIEVTEVTP